VLTRSYEIPNPVSKTVGKTSRTKTQMLPMHSFERFPPITPINATLIILPENGINQRNTKDR
jgi:hypothetical protein